ncbi:hypothetical protein BD626DRAFT_570473 [Schizophyllum amplum]|uniref:Uncharacterized protein n=1 Tax=Schizophyllum amplum TaxID=97359 RepID=A0A550CAD0_9AGAR|nr:hypothetical protein BD626DRAFT_570473 [Auriculariopsis ampla]
MSNDIKSAVLALQKATKRQRKKDILAGIESIQATVPLLSLSNPSDSSLRKLAECLRAPLLPLYADHTECMLKYCRAVLIHISETNINAFTGPGKDDLRSSWEPVLDSLVNGVIDFLESNSKKAEEIKSFIGDVLYSALCHFYLPKDENDIVCSGPSLLSAVYMLMSDAAIKHSDNRRRLRSPDLLGPKRIGWMLSQTKEFVVVEHLLEVFATALPSSNDQGGATRLRFIQDVFDPALFRCHADVINILANMRSADWSETSPHIMAALAEGSLTYPQPFDVSGFLVGSSSEKLDNGRLYVDDKGLYANVEQDDAFDHLTASYRTVIGIHITNQDIGHGVHVSLHSPPLLGKELYPSAGAKGELALTFRVKARDVDRFKRALKARGLASKILTGDKKVSTAEVIVEFDKDPDEPVASTQSKVKRVEEVWNSSSAGAAVIEPTSPLLDTPDSPSPRRPKSTRPKPKPKPRRAGQDEPGTDSDPFIISRKRQHVPDSDNQGESRVDSRREKRSRKNANASIEDKSAEPAPSRQEAAQRVALKDKKRPPPNSDPHPPGAPDEQEPPSKRARVSAKEDPPKNKLRDLFDARPNARPARVAKRYGKTGRTSSPRTATTHRSSDFDAIPGTETAKAKKVQDKVVKQPKTAQEGSAKDARKGKLEKKTDVKKKPKASTTKSDPPSAIPDQKSDDIEEPTESRTSARVKKGEALGLGQQGVAKQTERNKRIPKTRDLKGAKATTSTPGPTSKKAHTAPWDELKTPKNSKGNSKTSRLLAAMDDDTTSPIFGGDFDEPLTPLEESDTEYRDFVQDLLPITSDEPPAADEPPAVDEINAVNDAPAHIDLTTNSPLPDKIGKTATSAAAARRSSGPTASAATEPAGRPSAASSTKTVQEKTAFSSVVKERTQSRTTANGSVSKPRAASHVKPSFALAHDTTSSDSHARGSPPARTSNNPTQGNGEPDLSTRVSRVREVTVHAMPPPKVPLRSTLLQNDTTAISTPHLQERRTSGTTLVGGDSAQALQSLLCPSGIASEARRAPEFDRPKSNLKSADWPATPSPPEILQRQLSRSSKAPAHAARRVQDTSYSHESPSKKKELRHVHYPGKIYETVGAAKVRSYKDIEDIIEVMNEIHDVIIDKVSGRFVGVKKGVRAGQHSMLKDAAEGFRDMDRENIEHYNAVLRLEEEYATYCRMSIDGWASLRQVGDDLKKSIDEVVQRHDRGSLARKFPASLVPALPKSLQASAS